MDDQHRRRARRHLESRIDEGLDPTPRDGHAIGRGRHTGGPFVRRRAAACRLACLAINQDHPFREVNPLRFEPVQIDPRGDGAAGRVRAVPTRRMVPRRPPCVHQAFDPLAQDVEHV